MNILAMKSTRRESTRCEETRVTLYRIYTLDLLSASFEMNLFLNLIHKKTWNFHANEEIKQIQYFNIKVLTDIHILYKVRFS